MQTLVSTATSRIRELRTSRGLRQQDLVVKVNKLGVGVDRTALSKLEAGTRGLSLEEALAFAWALDVAPVHLLVPTDNDAPIRLAPNVDATPAELRAWIRGSRPLFQDARLYFSTVPPHEFPAELREG